MLDIFKAFLAELLHAKGRGIVLFAVAAGTLTIFVRENHPRGPRQETALFRASRIDPMVLLSYRSPGPRLGDELVKRERSVPQARVLAASHIRRLTLEQEPPVTDVLLVPYDPFAWQISDLVVETQVSQLRPNGRYPVGLWPESETIQPFGPVPPDSGVGAIPETSTWSMMVMGLFVVGAIARRRPLTQLRQHEQTLEVAQD